jgi:hypothetical protein
MQMNTSASNTGGYGTYALAQVESLYASLDQSLQDAIKKVNVTYNEGNVNYATSFSHKSQPVHLFLASYKEVGFTIKLTGTYANGYNAEGSRFDYFLEDYLPQYRAPRHVSIATGVAAYDTIKAMATELETRIEGLRVDVHRIVNRFFGESITVSGLLTGGDIAAQLEGKELGDLLLFPGNALRSDGDLFLDDLSPEALSQKLSVPVSPAGNSGADFICDVLGVSAPQY